MDPGATGELEAEPGGLRDGGREADSDVRWLEHDDADAGPPAERRESGKAIPDGRRSSSGRVPGRADRGSSGPVRQVDDEQVHRPSGE